MADVTIKGLPDAVFEEIKRQAAQSRRSVNSELILRLKQSVGRSPEASERLLAEVDALRERVSAPPLTDKAIRDAKNAGRL